MKKFLRNNIWLFLIIALALLFPQSLSSQAELGMRMIISGVGIDYVDDKYEITAQVVLPAKSEKAGGINAKIGFVTEPAATIGEGVNAVSKKFGKIAEFSHLEYILIGEGFENKNLAGELDYFFRNFKLKNSIMLLSTEQSSAKETITKVGKLDLGVALSMQKIYYANQENLNAISKTYVDFISESLSADGISVLDTLVFEEEEADGQTKQSQMKILSPLKIYKNGEFAAKIEDENDIFAYYFYNRKSKSGNMQLENFSFGDVLNANINIRIDDFKKHKSVNLDVGFPTLSIKFDIIESHIDEIAGKSINAKLFTNYLDKDLQTAIITEAQNKLKNQLYALFEKCKQNNIDIFGVAREYNRYAKQDWQNYLDGLANKEHYLQNCNLDIEVEFDKLR